MTKMALVLLFSILFVACATTKIATYKSTEANKQYSNILVMTSNIDYLTQKNFEDKTVAIINNCCNIKAVASYTIFPPTQNLSESDVKKIIKDSNFDGILTFAAKSTQVEQQNSIMPVTSPTYGRVAGRSFSATTTSYVPYSYSVIHHAEDINLIDVKTNKSVWFASTNSESSSGNDINDMIIKTTIRELFKSGLLTDEKCYENYTKTSNRNKR